MQYSKITQNLFQLCVSMLLSIYPLLFICNSNLSKKLQRFSTVNMGTFLKRVSLNIMHQMTGVCFS